MELTEIGHFQLQNLLNARVVFNLVMIDIDLESHYGVMERMHIKQWGIFIKESSMDQILAEIKKTLSERQMDLSAPIVVICQNGKTSKDLCKKLLRDGYKNTFIVSGGYSELINNALEN